jgi:plasmid stabilization system protein ParE
MKYNLIIQPEAEYDIQDAFEWYESQNPGLGSEFIRAVDACLSGIARNPLANPRHPQTGKKSINPSISLHNSLRF